MRQPVEELIEKYKDTVFRAALSVSRNPEDAEDIYSIYEFAAPVRE